MLCKIVLTFECVTYIATIQMAAIEYFFPLVLFIGLYASVHHGNNVRVCLLKILTVSI